MNVPKRKLTRYLKIAIGICVISLIFIVGLIWSQPLKGKSNKFNASQSLKILNDRIDVDSSTKMEKSLISVDASSKALLFSIDGSTKHYLKINFPHKLVKVVNDPSQSCGPGNFKPGGPQETYPGVSGNVPQMCVYFEDKVHVAVYDSIVAGMHCHYLNWHTNDTHASISNSIGLGHKDPNWYGGGGLSEQRWPLQRVNVPLQPYLTNKFKGTSDTFDSFIEPYFISSNGAAVLLESYLPLFVSMNSNGDRKLTFKSVFRQPFSSSSFKEGLNLNYKVCKSSMARTVHQKLSRVRLSQAAPVAPSEDLLRLPIWSSRAFQDKDLNERELITFRKNITQWKLPNSHLFIEGNYSKEKGVFFFNENKFPHSHQLIMEFKSAQNPKDQKLLVNTEVFPHVPKSGVPGSKSPFHIQYTSSAHKKSPLLPESPLYLDVTNKEAVQWFKSQLLMVKDIGVQGFHFADGHASNILPSGVQQSDLITNKSFLHPNQFTELYGQIAGNISMLSTERFSILSSGYRAQKYSFIADAGPFCSSWHHMKGLKAVIPTTITYGLLGYPFVLTGPVGGLYHSGGSASVAPPSQELYIRWLSLAAYLPVMELAWSPWLYSREVITHARTMLEQRKFSLWQKYLSGAVKEAAKDGMYGYVSVYALVTINFYLLDISWQN